MNICYSAFHFLGWRLPVPNLNLNLNPNPKEAIRIKIKIRSTQKMRPIYSSAEILANPSSMKVVFWILDSRA